MASGFLDRCRGWSWVARRREGRRGRPWMRDLMLAASPNAPSQSLLPWPRRYAGERTVFRGRVALFSALSKARGGGRGAAEGAGEGCEAAPSRAQTCGVMLGDKEKALPLSGCCSLERLMKIVITAVIDRDCTGTRLRIRGP